MLSGLVVGSSPTQTNHHQALTTFPTFGIELRSREQPLYKTLYSLILLATCLSLSSTLAASMRSSTVQSYRVLASRECSTTTHWMPLELMCGDVSENAKSMALRSLRVRIDSGLHS